MAGNEMTVVCDRCGLEYGIGAYPFCRGSAADHGSFRQTHGDQKSYPFVTKNFNGKPIEVTSAAHERSLMKQYGVVKRDDVGFIEKEYLGYNYKTGKQEYKEGRGVGLPGCWI